MPSKWTGLGEVPGGYREGGDLSTVKFTLQLDFLLGTLDSIYRNVCVLLRYRGNLKRLGLL